LKNFSTVLSTKILSKSQKELLLNARIGLVEYNAITIEILEDSYNYRNFGG